MNTLALFVSVRFLFDFLAFVLFGFSVRFGFRFGSIFGILDWYGFDWFGFGSVRFQFRFKKDFKVSLGFGFYVTSFLTQFRFDICSISSNLNTIFKVGSLTTEKIRFVATFVSLICFPKLLFLEAILKMTAKVVAFDMVC